jgi:predicted transcriptional regulator
MAADPPSSEPESSVSLSDLQMDVMRVLWTRGECGASDVAKALRARRDLALTTVSTLLTRLEKRRLIAQRREGRQVIYRPLVEESQVRRSMVSGLLGSLFGGDANALVAHLVREDAISADDLAAIRRLLDEKADRHD